MFIIYKNRRFLAALCIVYVFSAVAFIYDITQSFEQNCVSGPLFSGQIPVFKRSQTAPKTLFGHPIASCIGVPTCALMTGKGVAFAAQLGFDIVTYKTIRSAVCKSPAYPYPNIYFVDIAHQLERAEIGATFCITDNVEPYPIAIANSFGNGCPDLDWVKHDIAYARQSLKKNQLLIVSVCGVGYDEKSIIEDFVAAAKIAYESGAQVIELNLSCPNMNCKLLYKDCVMVERIVSAVAHSFTIPVTIKVGVFDSYEQMQAVFKAAARAGAKGICGINSIPIKLVNAQGDPAFGKDRETCGLSGNPIKNLAKEFVIMARAIIDQEELDLVLFATGGITSASDFKEFLELGADVALSASGMMSDPYIGIQYHELMHEFIF